MAIVNTSIAPLLKEGSNVTLTQDGQVITIATTGGGGTPGGSDTQIQFNDGGAFGGDAGLTYDKTNNIVDLESIDFATTPTAAAATYRLNADDSEGSLNLGLKGGNVNIALGAEVVIMSYNAEATTLNKGEVVYLYGAQGQRPSVKRASNTADSTSATTFGMVAESIAAGAEGFVIQIGVLRNIDTNAYNEGDILWLGSTAGSVTTTKPYAPNHGVFVGVVLKKNVTSGRIFVKPQNGYEMDELHNVSAQSPSNNDILAYNTSTSLWEKKQLSAINGITGTGTTNYLPKFTGASTIGNSTIQDLTTGVLVSPSVTASGAIARGLYHTPSLTAAANNDVLVGLEVNPTFTNGAFTGVSNFGITLRNGKLQVLNGWNLNTGTSDVAFFGNPLVADQFIAVDALASGASGIIFRSQQAERWRIFRAGTTANLQFQSAGLGYSPFTLFYSTGNTFLGQTPVDSGFKLDVNGLVNFTGTTASDGGQLGAELLSAAGWTSTGWTGSFGAGWTHTVGNTTALTNTLAAVNGNYYYISWVVTGRTAGTFVIAYGGFTSGSTSSTGNIGPRATSSGTLSITPTTDFDGTIVISIKQITIGSASVTLKNSSGTVTNELSSIRNDNLFIGTNSGKFVASSATDNYAFGRGALYQVTTGTHNVAIGRDALASVTWGYQNTAIGYRAANAGISISNAVAIGFDSAYNNTNGAYVSIGHYAARSSTTGIFWASIGRSAGFSNQTGSSWTAIGDVSGYSNTTGGSWTSIGQASGYNNGTGSNWIAIGQEAARYYAGGTSAATSFSNGVYLGNTTKVGAAGAANEIVIGYQAEGLGSNTTVIGNSSTTYGRWWGNLLVGTSTNSGFALDVSGTARVQTSNERPLRLDNTNGNYIQFVVGAGSDLSVGNTGVFLNGSLIYQFNSTRFLFSVPDLRVDANTKTFRIYGGFGGNTLGNSIIFGPNTINEGVFTATSGTQNTVTIGNTNNEIWQPSTGNATYNLLTVTPRINTSGTYSGTVRGLYVNATLTSTTGTSFRAIETTTGDIYFASTSGSVGIGVAPSATYKLDVNGTARIQDNLTISDAKNIILDTTTGTKIGTATTQKIGFFNATPVVQPSAYTQTYSTATKTHSNLTSADLTGITSSTTGSALAEPSATYTQAEMQQNFRRIQDQYNALKADLTNLKQVVNQIIDDHQSLGLLG